MKRDAWRRERESRQRTWSQSSQLSESLAIARVAGRRREKCNPGKEREGKTVAPQLLISGFCGEEVCHGGGGGKHPHFDGQSSVGSAEKRGTMVEEVGSTGTF